MVGNDIAARTLRGLMEAAGIQAHGLVEDQRWPTVEKVRIVTERNEQVARVDYEQDDDISGRVEDAVVERIAALDADAAVLLVSDYLKSTITDAVMRALTSTRRSATPLLIDPKIPQRCGIRSDMGHIKALAPTQRARNRGAFTVTDPNAASMPRRRQSPSDRRRPHAAQTLTASQCWGTDH